MLRGIASARPCPVKREPTAACTARPRRERPTADRALRRSRRCSSGRRPRRSRAGRPRARSGRRAGERTCCGDLASSAADVQGLVPDPARYLPGRPPPAATASSSHHRRRGRRTGRRDRGSSTCGSGIGSPEERKAAERVALQPGLPARIDQPGRRAARGRVRPRGLPVQHLRPSARGATSPLRSTRIGDGDRVRQGQVSQQVGERSLAAAWSAQFKPFAVHDQAHLLDVAHARSPATWTTPRSAFASARCADGIGDRRWAGAGQRKRPAPQASRSSGGWPTASASRSRRGGRLPAPRAAGQRDRRRSRSDVGSTWPRCSRVHGPGSDACA